LTGIQSQNISGPRSACAAGIDGLCEQIAINDDASDSNIIIQRPQPGNAFKQFPELGPIPEFAEVGHQIVAERQVLQRRKLRNAGQRANVVLREQHPLAVPLVDGGHRVNVADTASDRAGHTQRSGEEKTKRR
jgi:hypothetical protein